MRYLVFTLFILLIGCKTKTITETKEVSVVDSTAVNKATEKIDSLNRLVNRVRVEKILIETQLATLTKGEVDDKDTSLPVKEFRTESGKHYFEAQYQGNLIDYTFYIAQTESKQENNYDSISYWKDRYYHQQDSINSTTKKKNTTKENIETTEKPSLLMRLWNGFKYFWWFLILGAVGYAILRRYIPFLP